MHTLLRIINSSLPRDSIFNLRFNHMRVTTLSEYRDIQDFYARERITPRRERYAGMAQPWRLADTSVGSFRACPELRGIACATDGMILLVKTEDGRIVDGHLANWIEDADESNKRSARISSSGADQKKEFSRVLDARISAVLADLLA